MRQTLRRLFVATLGDLDIAPLLAAKLGAIRTGGPLIAIAFGKAARPMAETLRQCVPDARLRGLVVTPPGDDGPLPPFEVMPGGHPLPSEDSMRAAARALALCRAATADDRVVFLVSGGGSSMLELPADPRVTIDELRGLYRALIGCGADIGAINTVRRHLSAVKGGRLALAASSAARQFTFAVSDVPGNDPAVIASGPTAPDPTSPDRCRSMIARFGLTEAVPSALRARLDRDDLPAHLLPGDPLCGRCEYVVVTDNALARARLRARAETRDMLVVEDLGVDDLPFDVAAERLLARLESLHGEHGDRTVAILTGGELGVTLPATTGVGGRNQQFVLECARRIAGRPIAVLSAGTDGVDGNSPAAGAVADGTTAARAGELGLDINDHLERFDAHSLFDALGDTVMTGPSGQNVRDLRLLVQTPACCDDPSLSSAG